MVRKVKLDNVGEEPTNEDALDVVFEDQSNTDEADFVSPIEDEGGFAPGALEHIQATEGEHAPHAVGAETPHSQSENGNNGDEETVEERDQREADMAAAGVNINEAAEEKARKREYKTLMKDVGALGTIHGGGKTSMINLAERVTEAAMKKAVYPDDADAIYDKFKEAADAKGQLEDAGVVPDVATMERAPIQTYDQSRASQLSKLKAFIKLGNKWDKEALDLVRRTRNIHISLLGGDREVIKTGSTYSIMTSVASANEKRSHAQGVMDDNEIRAFLAVAKKGEPEPVTGPKKILDALIAARSAKKGGKEREGIENDHLDAAISELTQALADVDPGRLAKHEAEEAEAQAEADRKADEKAARDAERNAKAAEKANKKAA